MAFELGDPDELARTWSENPDVIRDFIEVRPQFEQLCSEVAYIIDKRMNDEGIEFSAITSRAKSLKSFAEKLFRKHYERPLAEVTDLAGVRVVYLYKSDRSAIEKLIESEFVVVERVDKVDEQEADQFGYGALHYLVRLGRKSSGARYDALKGLVCEIQVRTVLQDSWAIIAHHLSYKQESDVPKVLRRKLNSLSGLFETADDQFEQVRAERRQYLRSVKQKGKSESDFLEQEVNLDSFKEFLRWKFPNRSIGGEGHLTSILEKVNEFGYRKLSDLNRIIDRTGKARAARYGTRTFPAAGEIASAIAFLNPTYRSAFHNNHNFGQYEHLIMGEKGSQRTSKGRS